MKQEIKIIFGLLLIVIGLGFLNSKDHAGASYSPIMDSPFISALAALPSMNNSMIHIDASGALSQTTAYDFGVSLISAPDATTARTLLGMAGTGSGTVTSIIAGTGLSGGTITNTGTISLPSTGTAGTYSGVTTDAQGRVTAGTNRSWNNVPARSIVTGTGATGFQPSSTKDTLVRYGIKVTSTASIASGQEGYVTLEIAATNSATPSDWVNMGLDCGNGQTYSLAIALQGVQPTYCELSATVPVGYYVKLRSVNVTGTPTYSYLGGQEMSF